MPSECALASPTHAVAFADLFTRSEGSDAPKPVSKRKMRKMARLSVAELKRIVQKPEVVEWTDVTAQDPRLLVMLKSYRNTVPIPAHWAQKRDYLQGKRGLEKPPFQLPSASSSQDPGKWAVQLKRGLFACRLHRGHRHCHSA